jgi:hypothetical protein
MPGRDNPRRVFCAGLRACGRAPSKRDSSHGLLVPAKGSDVAKEIDEQVRMIRGRALGQAIDSAPTAGKAHRGEVESLFSPVIIRRSFDPSP